MFCLPGTSSLAFLVGRIVISISRRMDCSLNENYINYGELRCDSVMTAHEFELPLVFLEIIAVVTLQTFYLGKHDLLTVYLGKLDFFKCDRFFPR